MSPLSVPHFSPIRSRIRVLWWVLRSVRNEEDGVSNVKIQLLQNNLLTPVTCWTNSHLNTAAVAINPIAFLG